MRVHSEIATSNIPRISRYQATKIEITISVGSGHTIVAMPAATATIPPTIVSTRHPPSVTDASANCVTAPSQNTTAIRMMQTEIDAGRSERTMKPRRSQRIPLMRNIHHRRA